MKQENPAFVAFDNTIEGLVFNDIAHPRFPIKYYNVHSRLPELYGSCSYYGYVYGGYYSVLFSGSGIQTINDGMFFSTAGKFSITDHGPDARMVLIEVWHTNGDYQKNKFRAYTLFGGPIEQEGRLKYIDGCTDSLLIPPVKMGDPCLNHLHFPRNITQTSHTHPSHRIGIVADGRGTCVTPFGLLPLEKGMIFVIKEDDGTLHQGLDGDEYPAGEHKFDTQDSHMDVIAFHPDSDFGATDEVHPMINRTMVEGVSASNIESIRTK